MNPKTLEIRHTCAAIARVSRAQAMPSSPIRGAAVLPYVIAGALALAVTAAAAKGAAGRCPIEIDGTRFVDGSCRIERTPQGGSVRARASKYHLCSPTCGEGPSRVFHDGQHGRGAAEELESAAVGGNVLVVAGVW